MKYAICKSFFAPKRRMYLTYLTRNRRVIIKSASDKYLMRYREIIEAEAVVPLTPKQARKRAEKQQKVQARIAAEKKRSAEKVQDMRQDLP